MPDAPRPFAALRDDRSLIELVGPATPPSAPVTRSLGLPTGTALPLMPGFAGVARPQGTYAIVRGVPGHARLSHGIAVGGDSWLVDGVDIANTTIEVRDGAPNGPMPLEMTLLSSDSAPPPALRNSSR